MTDNSALCTHCQLPVRSYVQRREVNGEVQVFCCYGCCLAYLVKHGSREEPVAAWLLIRLGIGAFLAMNIMLFSLMLYSESVSTLSASLLQGIHILLWILATPVVFFVGGPFIRGAWEAARQCQANADTLVSVGTLGAYGYSVLQILTGGEVVYFDTATMVVVLFTVGRYLEAQARVRTTRSLMPLLEAERAIATVIENHQEREQPIVAIAANTLVRVPPGERIPVDGVVVEGHSSCNEEILTGQSTNTEKQPGSAVYAGSVNRHGQLLIRTTVSGQDTYWVRMSRQIRQTLAHKTLVGRLVDRVSAVFVFAVLMLGIGTVYYWSQHTSFEQALLSGMAVLVVACPCALGLAAPLATAIGLGQAAQHGIILREGGVFEYLARLKGVAFDKTGTLTAHSLAVAKLVTVPHENRVVLERAASLAQGFSHPKAAAILQTAKQRAITPLPVTEFQAHAGMGVSAKLAEIFVAMGSLDLMHSLGWTVPTTLNISYVPGNHSIVYIGWHGSVHGAFELTEALDPQVPPMIEALHAAGLRTYLISGDDPVVVEQSAKQAGVQEWQGGLLPLQKVETLGEWTRQHGPVAMVGDGINDGPVLAKASIGVAVGNATDLARASADVTLSEAALERLPWLIILARRVQKTVWTNLIWALSYNLVALSLAAAGLLLPVIAAALMAGSSMVVVINSLIAAREVDGSSGTAMHRQTALTPVPFLRQKKV